MSVASSSNASRTKLITPKEKKYSGGKSSKVRLTGMLAASATGKNSSHAGDWEVKKSPLL